jgi:hypothetical protein
MTSMTAKEALKEHVDTMTEEEAQELLWRLEWESTEEETLTDEEMAEVLEGEREIEAGLGEDLETVLRRLDL